MTRWTRLGVRTLWIESRFESSFWLFGWWMGYRGRLAPRFVTGHFFSWPGGLLRFGENVLDVVEVGTADIQGVAKLFGRHIGRGNVGLGFGSNPALGCSDFDHRPALGASQHLADG